MLLRKWLVPFILLLLTALPVTAFAVGGNLIENPGFDAELSGWGFSAWESGELYATATAAPEGQSGSPCAVIVNSVENDAHLSQYVKLKKNSTYRVAAKVKFEGAGTCNISLLNTGAVSPFIHDTDGSWSDAEVYVKTENRDVEVQVALRVGYYGRLEAGTAYFDNVTVEEAAEVPADVVPLPVATHDNSVDTSLDAPDRSGMSAVVFAALFVLAGVMLYGYAARRGEIEKRPAGFLLGGILLAGLAVRAVIAYKVPGYAIDINCFGGWGSWLLTAGPRNFYAEGYFCDYPPGYLPVLALLSALTQRAGTLHSEPLGQLILKTPSILCDLAACFVLYRIASQGLKSEKWGLFAAALYAFCPAVIADSAAWGQIDGVLTLLMALSMLFMLRRKMTAASLLFLAGVLIKPQALMFGPVLALSFLHEIVRDGKKGAFRLLACFGMCAALFGAVVVIFGGFNNPMWIVDKYFSTMTSYPYATVNAMNLFALLEGNWTDQGTRIFGAVSYETLGTLLMVVSIGYALALYLLNIRNGGDRRALFLSALVLLCGVFTFGVRMHERYLFPAMALLIICFLLYRDRRFLAAFFGISAAQAINILVVLAHEHIQPGDRLLMLVGSVLNILSTVYLFGLAFRICILGARVKGDAAFAPPRAPHRTVISVEQPTLRHPGGRDMRLTRTDALLMAAVTCAYALLAFMNLGDTDAPGTSFRASNAAESVVFDLGVEQNITRFYYYGEIPDATLTLSFAGEDAVYGADYPVAYKDNVMFVWKIADVAETARYAKVTFETPGATFFEFGFTGDEGIPFPVQVRLHDGAREDARQDPSLLIDEQNFVPERPTYLNSMYFDEIYHARTAYEHIHGMDWYESTHPPLGKVFMSWCIQAFGMNPFAWRLAGTLAGILMLPGMYLIGKLLFRRSELAFASMFLMAVDCMHFAQTRIATIDSFPVLFIIWAYFFMFLYANMSFHHDRLSRTLPPLFASGLFMGLGCASKWIGIYAGAGLAVIFFGTMLRRYLEYRQAGKLLAQNASDKHSRAVVSAYWMKTLLTLTCCVVFFIGIPLAIYYFSYYQYLAQPGKNNSWRGVWNYQTHMFNYHKQVFDSHPYESSWYQWPVIWKPIAFFFDYRMEPGWSSAISSFGNPAVWWAGLAALLWMIWRLIHGDARRDSRIWLVVVGFAAQYLPWVLVPRTTYIYHYFASVPFLILCICFFWEKMLDGGKRRAFIGYLVAAAVLFALFYPVASGMPIPIDFAKLANWLPSWHLFWGG